MKYIKFSSPRSGNDAKNGVELRHLTHNVSTIQQKVENLILMWGTA